jgi:hypothetical protein
MSVYLLSSAGLYNPLIYQALLDCKFRLFIKQRWIVYSAYLSSTAGL